MKYVIGHKNPDTDTVVAAVSMAALLKARGEEATPVRTAEVNAETAFVFEKFDVDLPEVLENAEGKQLFLVDHNEPGQRVDGAEEIVGMVDHHKMNFTGSDPIEIVTKPWGSSNTVIYDMFEKEGHSIPDELKPLMLCALLSDTVILKSPTTTEKDREVVKKLSEDVGVKYEELGMDMFKAKAKVASKTPEEIINNDFKDLEFNGKHVGIGQIEVPDLTEVEAKLPEIVEKMKEMKGENYALLLMLTDIIQEGSKLVIVGDEENIAGFFDVSFENNVTAFIPGMMSRKKQVVPVLSEKLS